MNPRTFTLVSTVAGLLLAGALQADSATPPERIAALKASLVSSQATLKQYEWIETTVVSLQGEEKSRQLSRCYQGDDGRLQKVPVTSPPPEQKRRGVRGRVAEAKKEELTDAMKEAIALARQYVPPDHTRIQAAKDAGKASYSPLPGQRARLTFTDYLKPGDTLAIDVDLANNRPLEAKVSTYADSKAEQITLDIRFGTLDNGATYPQTSTLEAKSKNLTVVIENSGYRRTAK